MGQIFGETAHRRELLFIIIWQIKCENVDETLKASAASFGAMKEELLRRIYFCRCCEKKS